MSVITTLGIDIGKDVFHVVGFDERGHTVERRACSRTGLLRYLARLRGCDVAMEACAGAHWLARKAQEFGHTPHVLPAQYVRAYRKSQKNDYADAEAIAEAATRASMREVAVKSVSQQELQLLHRQRASWVRTRTEHANRCRAILQEFGLTLPKGIASVRNRLPLLIEDAEVALPERMRALLYELWADIRGLDERLAGLDRELGERLNADPRGRRLLAVPGIGPVVGSGLWAALMEHNGWRCGRDFAVWLGLTPKQHSTGGRSRLGAITKRGDAYLRMQLIHGARSVVRQAHRGDDALRRWLQALIGRRPKAVAITALANKLARLAWAVVHHNSDFDARHAAA